MISFKYSIFLDYGTNIMSQNSQGKTNRRQAPGMMVTRLPGLQVRVCWPDNTEEATELEQKRYLALPVPVRSKWEIRRTGTSGGVDVDFLLSILAPP